MLQVPHRRGRRKGLLLACRCRTDPHKLGEALPLAPGGVQGGRLQLVLNQGRKRLRLCLLRPGEAGVQIHLPTLQRFDQGPGTQNVVADAPLQGRCFECLNWSGMEPCWFEASRPTRSGNQTAAEPSNAHRAASNSLPEVLGMSMPSSLSNAGSWPAIALFTVRILAACTSMGGIMF